MNFSNDSALKVAEFLLQIKAIKLQPSNPFTWSSGWLSPIYCDNRRTLSYPRIRTFIRQEMVKTINDNFGKPDVIAGVATGGIAHAALVAQELGVPMVYIRPNPKEHGLANKVEGVVESGQSVIVIEDLVSTGASSLKAVDVLRDSGCIVKGMVAIFTYEFEAASKKFKSHKCPLVTLSNYSALIEKALETKYITDKDLQSLKTWRDHPETWGK